MTHQVNLSTPPDLWGAHVEKLDIRIEGSPMWPFVQRLYEELSARGIDFRPPCFVGNEWGCPDGQPIIGVPFYLIDPRMWGFEERHADDLEEGERLSVAFRHEAGHAILYAYKLYEEPEWRELFGRFDAAYRDDYLPDPFSRDFVRHLPGFYAQKHPDEDFAETFAVWLTPGLDWRKKYAGWGALAKLEYVDRAMARIRGKVPLIDPATCTPDPKELDFTVEEYYRRRTAEDTAPVDELGTNVDDDLRELFSAEGLGTDAGSLVWDRRRTIMRMVSAMTGARMFAVRSIIVHLASRLRALGLRAAPGKDIDSVIGFTSLVSTLAVKFLRTGHLA